MIHIEEYSATQLEGIVSSYPYFAYARELLISKLAESGREYAEEEFKKNSAFFPSIAKIHSLLSESAGTALTAEGQEKETEPESNAQEPLNELIDFAEIEKIGQDRPQYILVGADYFSADDLQSVKDESFKIERSRDGVGAEAAEEMAPLELDLSDFYTETLARIYAEQGYYDEAIKVYSKLILLYPEKSAYFAGLISELKLKN